LVEGVGKIALADITLVEDPNEEDRNETEKPLLQNEKLESKIYFQLFYLTSQPEPGAA